MKRILFITHTISMGGGAEKVLNTLIEQLASDYNIDILERMEDSINPFHIEHKNVKHIGAIEITDRKAKSLGKSVIINKIKHNVTALLMAIFPSWLYKRHINSNYDYEISFNYLYPSLLVASSPNRHSKKIMWIHGAFTKLIENNPSLSNCLYRWIQHRAFNKADAIIAISNRTHKSISIFQSNIEHKIHSIYNGYDFNEIYVKSQEFLYEKSDNFRLISVGRLDFNKNVSLQIQAVELLRKRGINIELLIIGTGDKELQLKELSHDNPNIRFIGFQGNPYPYILSSDGLILTSFSEGFPTVAVEAMALGKPVISTAVAGTEELINAETGLIVQWEAEEVANGIMTLMNRNYDSEIIKRYVIPYTNKNWGKNVKDLLNELSHE